ncbi:aromatic ring-hydroxylating oxygenase subunit alpha [Halioxenophilus aromaticivorans]|uniref:Aromatic ring-hydroxylating dioxygenase subunit alpha n=1 Tax=Halioxenophilus aromaticivorans TaxID=1306992 RepID=A0AAV3TY24_9ALTE
MKEVQSESSQEFKDSWLTLDHGVRSGRYTDPEFTALEHEKMWRNAWQSAARLDEIPNVGDYTVYEIGHESALVVRVDDETIKAYHNFCPHRGTALGEGTGNFEKSRIICPFHGWRWDTAGSCQFIMEQNQFRDGQLAKSDANLKEIHHQVFAGFIFVNFSRTPEPFEVFIAPVKQLIEDLAIEHMRPIWWKRVVAPANWKVALEAFLEGYHVPATHPQLEKPGADFLYGDDVSGSQHFAHHDHLYEAFDNGHGRFLGGEKTPMAGHTTNPESAIDAMADRLNLLVEGMDAMILKEDVALVRSFKDKEIPEDSSIGKEYVKGLYANAAVEGRPMPKLEKSVLDQWGGEVFVYPNLLILPQAGNCMMYRIRPNGFDPDSCIFEIYSTKTYGENAEVPKAVVKEMDDVTDPEQFLQIPRQDFGNIPRMQKGLHTSGCKQIWFANYYEKILLNFHQQLDRDLQR